MPSDEIPQDGGKAPASQPKREAAKLLAPAAHAGLKLALLWLLLPFLLPLFFPFGIRGLLGAVLGFPGWHLGIQAGTEPGLWVAVWLTVHIGFWIGFWTAVVCAYRRGSWSYFLILLCCGVAAVQGRSWLRTCEREPDWTERGLNPDRPGIEPQVVILAGVVKASYRSMDSNRRRSQEDYFEIRMRGADYYYCRRWQGTDLKEVGSRFQLELELADFNGRWAMMKLPHTTRGRGGSTGGFNDRVVVGRRLWEGERFVGAKPEERFLKLVHRSWAGGGSTTRFVGPAPDESVIPDGSWEIEEFTKLVQVGRHLIPTRISYTDSGNERRETYEVKRIEFSNRPTADWFQAIRKKHFERDPNPAYKNEALDEPGPFPEVR